MTYTIDQAKTLPDTFAATAAAHANEPALPPDDLARPIYTPQPNGAVSAAPLCA